MRLLFEECGLPPDKLIDRTSFSKDDHRGTEIKEWMEKHPEVTSFVILDDDDDMEPFKNRLVQTDMRFGLSELDANKAISLLT